MSHANDRETVSAMAQDPEVRRLANELIAKTLRYKYSYNFTWLGRPVIQFPPDVLAIQELIWRVEPDVVIETGIAHGGSLVHSASILELLGGDRRVIGIDIEIRPHNRAALEAHPLFRKMTLIEGSSIDPATLTRVEAAKASATRPLVILDSMHTHAHVLEELRLYSRFVKEGSYLIVMDTVIEDLPNDAYADRPWSVGDNPKTAVHAFLEENSRFVIDREVEDRLLITACPDGFLRCTRN